MKTRGKPKKAKALEHFDRALTFETIAQASAATGIPRALLTRTKAQGANGFRGSRLDLVPWLRWYFSTGVKDSDASTDWKARRTKAQALREELELETARGEVLPAAGVQRGIAKAMAVLWGVWDRNCSLIPPRAKGLDERGIKALMIEAAEEAKREARREFESIVVGKEGEA